MSGTVLEPGTQVRFAKRTWTVVMLEGPCAKLIDTDNSVATVLANFLFADPPASEACAATICLRAGVLEAAACDTTTGPTTLSAG
ncbi:hypothetical protein ACF07Y_42540 [Streptomyces sp. NPDC016566]|uniref:hypothetical protein n=1 Tax=Streptomyces sp. NPDC016566 TaxID=3364967 RepID=UPI0036F57A8F